MVLACVAWFLPAGALAQLPQTRLNTVFPPGGKIGSDVKVSISGEFSEAATQLVFSHPGISAKQQIDAPSEYRVAHRRPRNFDVSIAPDVPRGSYEVRAVGPTNPGAFIPLEVQPFQSVHNRLGGAGHQPVLVGVFNPQHELAAVMPGKEPVEQGGADIAYVGQPGWAGRKPDPNVFGQIQSPSR